MAYSVRIEQAIRYDMLKRTVCIMNTLMVVLCLRRLIIKGS
jgi:hypothetical protein